MKPTLLKTAIAIGCGVVASALAVHVANAQPTPNPALLALSKRDQTLAIIDPATLKVVDRFPVGPLPQHIVPSWDLKTLWVNNNGRRGFEGSQASKERSDRPAVRIGSGRARQRLARRRTRH